MTHDDRGMLMLADSLAAMTHKPPPGSIFLLPNADGTYPEGYETSLQATQTATAAATVGETNAGGLDNVGSIDVETHTGVEADSATAMTQAPDVVPPSPELGIPAFTAEMAQAIVTGQEPPAKPPTPIPTADVSDVSTTAPENKNETSNHGQNTTQDASPATEYPSSSPQNISPSTPPAPASDEPDLLAGFDPSKYLSGGSAMPSPPPPSNTPKSLENTTETAPNASEETAYGDIQEGAGQGGQKDHREAMQMLRELSVLKGN